MRAVTARPMTIAVSTRAEGIGIHHPHGFGGRDCFVENRSRPAREVSDGYHNQVYAGIDNRKADNDFTIFFLVSMPQSPVRISSMPVRVRYSCVLLSFLQECKYGGEFRADLETDKGVNNRDRSRAKERAKLSDTKDPAVQEASAG